jgi:hypothetical protein
LYGIAAYCRKAGRQIGLDREPSLDQLMMQQFRCRIDELVKINGFGPVLTLLEQAAQPLNDFTGAIVFLHNIVQRIANLGEVRRFRRQQIARGLRIRQDGREWLIDLVSNRARSSPITVTRIKCATS